MFVREAEFEDIPAMHRIRIAVLENKLPRPSIISTDDYVEYLTRRGRGWVCLEDDVIAGFAIVDLSVYNVWALFVDPGYEGRRVGRNLQTVMLGWYFGKTQNTLWLGTAPGTRAEYFYRRTGWHPAGVRENGEIRFEMTYANWKATANECS